MGVVCTYHRTHAKARERLAGVSSLFQSCELQRSNSGGQVASKGLYLLSHLAKPGVYILTENVIFFFKKYQSYKDHFTQYLKYGFNSQIKSSLPQNYHVHYQK